MFMFLSTFTVYVFLQPGTSLFYSKTGLNMEVFILLDYVDVDLNLAKG
jgi:hypothetical protein